MQVGLERKAVIIEDDADVRNLLVAILHEAGFSCVATPNGLEGIEAVRENDPILTTLDVSLPGIDGFEVARRIRSFSTTYVIMLSARNEEIDTLMGLDAGADDYLTKPFRPRELRARIEAMLRRLGPQASSPAGSEASGHSADCQNRDHLRAAAATGVDDAPQPPAEAAAAPGPDDHPDNGWLHHNGLRINPDMWLCTVGGAPVELTRSEFDLLLALMQGRRRVITKDSLALELRGGMAGGYVSDADRRAVEVHIANLRRKLHDPVSSPHFIETVRGVGYRLADARPR